jgi:hypothetical protein
MRGMPLTHDDVTFSFAALRRVLVAYPIANTRPSRFLSLNPPRSARRNNCPAKERTPQLARDDDDSSHLSGSGTSHATTKRNFPGFSRIS